MAFSCSQDLCDKFDLIIELVNAVLEKLAQRVVAPSTPGTGAVYIHKEAKDYVRGFRQRKEDEEILEIIQTILASGILN